MKPTIILLLITLSINHLSSTTEAHFFPNISSIPHSLIPNKTAWDKFNSFLGCKKGVKAQNLSGLKKYFEHFGYYNDTDGISRNFTDDFDDRLEHALKAYQVNFNLEPTGVLDAQTLKHMVQPRCGNPDAVNGTSTMRPWSQSNDTNGSVHAVRHYSFFPNRPRWPPGRTDLTYAFVPGNELSDSVRSVFSRAFERWSEVTPMNFTETTSFSTADIRIGFFSGDHGDGEPFDGVMGTLAHAFSPPAGRLHLDGDENWVIDGGLLDSLPSLSSVDLESVAVHEIGHLLGLGHSSVEDAVMYPTIGPGTRKVELAQDDVLGIQELYGSNPNNVGSGPELTPRGANDRSGAMRVERGWIALLALLLFL